MRTNSALYFSTFPSPHEGEAVEQQEEEEDEEEEQHRRRNEGPTVASEIQIREKEVTFWLSWGGRG